MTEHESEIQPPDFEYDVPDEFFELEGEGELDDPSLFEEATEQQLRSAWNAWHCRRGSGKFVAVNLFGKDHPVAGPAYDAFKALEQALIATGYQPEGGRWSVGTFNCRHVNDSPDNAAKDRRRVDHPPSKKTWSLHAYGVAVDIDPDQNPFTKGEPYSGKIQRVHVEAVLGIKNLAGRSIWSWGGNWGRGDPGRKKDRMHFQLDQGPDGVAVNWSTVPGVEPVVLEGITHRVKASSLNLRSNATTSASVVASLPRGTSVAVQGTESRTANNYRWVSIKAGVGGRLVEGWVADDFLEAVPGAAPSDVSATTDTAVSQTTASAGAVPGRHIAATHLVNTKRDDLNLRSAPSLDAGVEAELPKGSEVEVQPGATAHADDLDWMRVKAISSGRVVEGWVAARFLKAL